jgi:hypothetical protein
MLCFSGRAPEYSARLPTGSATVGEPGESAPLGPAAAADPGAQNSARLPSGSGTLDRRPPAPDPAEPAPEPATYDTFMASTTCSASERYASAPGDVGACCSTERPNSGASAKRTDFGTGGMKTGNP